MSVPGEMQYPEGGDLFALMELAKKFNGLLLIPGKVASPQGVAKEQAPILKNAPPAPKPAKIMGHSKAAQPVVGKSSTPGKTDVISQQSRTLPTIKEQSQAAIWKDLGPWQPTAPELGDTTAEMGDVDSSDMGDSSISEQSDEPADMGEDQQTEGQGGGEPPEEPEAAPVRKPKPRNTPPVRLGPVKIKGSNLTGTISGVSEDQTNGGDRLFRCRPNGDCFEIVPEPDEVAPKPRKKPKKRRR